MGLAALDEPQARRQKRSDTGVLPTTGSSLVWPARSKSNTCHGKKPSTCWLCPTVLTIVMFGSLVRNTGLVQCRVFPVLKQCVQSAQLGQNCLPLQQAPARTAGSFIYHRQTITAGCDCQCRSFIWPELLCVAPTLSPVNLRHGHRTTCRLDVVEKLSSMPPATVPAARYGPIGLNAIAADTDACLKAAMLGWTTCRSQAQIYVSGSTANGAAPTAIIPLQRSTANANPGRQLHLAWRESFSQPNSLTGEA